jgi:hypothetical protein
MVIHFVGMFSTSGIVGRTHGSCFLQRSSTVSLFGVLVFWFEPVLLGLVGHIPSHCLVCRATLSLLSCLPN